MLALVVIVSAGIGLSLWRAYRPGGDVVERWAAEHGVALTGESRPLVAAYLRRARALRTWGGVAGVVVPTLVSALVEGRFVVLGFGADGDMAPLGFGSIFIGYLVGAVAAELTFARRPAGARRAAALTPRELPDYLAGHQVLSQRLLGVAAAAGFVAAGAVSYPAGASTPSTASIAVAAVAVLAFAAGLEAVERWIVRRPQPFADAAVIAADDAIRAQSVRAVAGAGLSLLWLTVCGLSLVLMSSEVEALHALMAVPAALGFVLALLAGRDVAEGSWRVRRAVRA